MQRGTFSFQLTLVMVGLFVALQLVVVVLTGTTRSITTDAVGLPALARLETMAEVIERSPPAQRAKVAEAFDGALYHITVARSDELSPLFAATTDSTAAITGRLVRRTAPMLGSDFISRLNPWPGWVVDAPAIAIRLADGGWLVAVGRPSDAVQSVLRRRAVLLGLGGIVTLVALALAVRATTLPLVRLAHGMRTFGGGPETPDLQITGSRELKDVATAYNEMKGRIAELIVERTHILGAIAHDMRTYLTRLRLRSEFIDDAGQRNRAVADLAEMAALLDDTLLLATGTREPEGAVAPIDLSEELADIVASHREAGENIEFLGIDGSAPSAIQRLTLRRIIGNVVDNALRHGDAVIVSLCAEGNQWRIEVADDGPGVSPEMVATLGEAFGRTDPSRDRASGGAGLGLAIVRALAVENAGKVVLANLPQGGFIATVWLPHA